MMISTTMAITKGEPKAKPTMPSTENAIRSPVHM